MNNDLYQQFVDCGAILKGHFKLSSGLHSNFYVQCALFLQNPKRSASAADLLVKKVPEKIIKNIELVAAPAMGGLIIGYEVARILNKNFIFFERVNSLFTLKRNFVINSGANILLVEDVVTTGKSSLEVIEKINSFGANVIAEACLIDRSNADIANNPKFKFPLYSLLKIKAETFPAENIPDELKNIPAVKPGSRYEK